MLQEIQHDFRTELNERRITFNVDLDEELEYQGEKLIFRIILENLIENSILFSSPDERSESFIKVVIRKHENNVVLKVEDNGEGIRSSAVPRIYDIFYKDSSKSKGDGIGLYVVKKATALIGGTIDLVTEKGSGTSFEVRIPTGDNV